MAYSTFPSINIDKESKRAITPRTLRAAFGDGYTQKAGDGVNPFDETWNISITNRTLTDITTMKTFLDNLITTADKFFYWTPPDETALTPNPKKWELDDSGYQQWKEELRYSISFKIKRIFGA